ncbi:DUF1156 domain-containing protein [Rhizobium leguminosarum]
MTYKKKLIEVAIPLEAINAASAREKSIRHGHPSTLHLWWARRPLAACRAVLFAQLVDDPSSNPEEFPTSEAQEAERKRLFKIIEDLVIWENSTNEEVLERARAEIRKSCGGVLPPVYDPFSGGGSIPLEAQRLGLPAYGSDLNPVAVMIGKAMIEIPPKFKDMPPIHPGITERQFYRNAEGLAEDVRYYGEWMREKAWERIGHLYPLVDLPKENGGGKSTVIAWLWSRTVPSPDPAFANTPVPITSSFLLSSKTGQEAWIEPIVDKNSKKITYRIRKGGTKAELALAKEGTKVGRGNFVCLLSNAAIDVSYVRQQAQIGNLGSQLIAIVAEGVRGRAYLEPTQDQELIALSATPRWKPEGKVPAPSHDVDRLPMYGMPTWGDAFSLRQLTGLTTFSDLVGEARGEIERDALRSGVANDPTPLRDGGLGALAYSEAVSTYLSFAISKLTNLGSMITTWMSDRGALRETFARQAIPMVWDYAEVNFFSNSGGNWTTPIDKISKAIAELPTSVPGSVIQKNASEVSYPNSAVISTDPPYYDNIGYADLSDFFFCWLRPTLRSIFPDIFGVLATPKSEELIASAYRHGGSDNAERFFLSGMTLAIGNMAAASTEFFPATIYYAFKQSEVETEGISSTGWATFLQAAIDAGFSVVGTWPVRTESPGRLIAKGTNALANSVVLVCRKRDVIAETITRAEFIRLLKRELPPAIAELQTANIAPADMPQSAIGPGMGVFSRYKAVLEAGDSPMTVKAALQLINRELDDYLGGIQGEFDPETRFAVTWFEQYGMRAGDYGSADNLARARGIAVESVKHAGVVESAAGKVRLLGRGELDDKWDPTEDRHLTIWECLQHLVKLHEENGIAFETASLFKQIGNQADAVKDLAYCLYDIAANKRNDAKEATAYNALIADWTELSRQAAAVHDVRGTGQGTLEL